MEIAFWYTALFGNPTMSSLLVASCGWGSAAALVYAFTPRARANR